VGRRKMVTIREEIEKLETYRHRILNYEYETINKADVLSIFDEWELVAEYDAPVDVGLHIIGKCDNYADVGLSLDFEEGDHIAIYVRRGKEDGQAK